MKGKLIQKIVGVALGLTMAIGVGVAVSNTSKDAVHAESTETSYTITFKTGSGDGTSASTSTSMTSFTSSSEVTGNAVTATNVYYSGSSGLKLGTSKAGGTLEFNLSSTGQVTATRVIVNAKRYNSTKAATIKLGSLATQNLTANFDDYEFALTGQLTSLSVSSSKYAWVSSISVYYNSESTDTTEVTGVSVTGITDGSTISDASYGDTRNLTATVSYRQGEGYVDGDNSVTWSSDNEDVALVSEDGEVTFVGNGEVTITATSDEDDNYSGSVTFTLEGIIAPAYSVGFETSEGFTASTTYNNSTPYEEGKTGKEWSILCGHATSTAAAVRSGSMGLHLRYYNSVEETPYAEMTWDVTDGHEMTFYAKGTANVNLKVEYSTDSGSTWTALLASQSVGSSSFSLVEATIPTYVSKARFRISSLSTTDKSGIYIDDLEITTMEEPTEPTIVISSKDGNGEMLGTLGDIQEVTVVTTHDTGLTLDWVLVDTESIIDWEEPYIEFLKVGADATLTAQLKDGENVRASDSVTLRTLVPSLDVRVDGISRANYSLYEEESITITALSTNMPSSATISWSTDDTDGHSTFDSSTGLFEAKSEGVVNVTVNMIYNDNTVATDSLKVTITALKEPTLVISSGSASTTYKYGEEIDTTGWSATYTDDHGVEHTDVLNNLVFDSLDFIGTKPIKATYLGTISNTVDVTVTNNGATVSPEVILESENLSESISDASSGWSASGNGSNYASQHSPYLLKMDSTGDSITAEINTSASEITVSLGVKMAGGANTSSFTVTTLDENENPISSISAGTLTISGSQNDIVNPTATLSNPNGETIRYIVFTFTKGSNVGVGPASISANNAASFAPKQALAYARYFLEQTSLYCKSTISSTVKTSLINEFNWMLPASISVFKDADVVRGKEVSYDDDISEALSRYVNMVEEYGYNDSEFLNLGSEIIHKTTTLNYELFINNNSTQTMVIVISIVALTTMGGYYFLRRRKEQ